MVAPSTVLLLVFFLPVSFNIAIAQVIPDIPSISRPPSPPPSPPESPSPSPLVSPTPSQSSIPSASSSPLISSSPSAVLPSKSARPSRDPPQQSSKSPAPQQSALLSSAPVAAASADPDGSDASQGAQNGALQNPSASPGDSAAAGASAATESSQVAQPSKSTSIEDDLFVPPGDAPQDPTPSAVSSATPTPSTPAEAISPEAVDSDGVPPDADEAAPAPTQSSPQPSMTTPAPAPSQSARPVSGGGASTNSTEQPVQGAEPTSKACVRDVSQPRPALGISPSRYAFSVFASAAAVAFANMLYKVAAHWETRENHMIVRLISIVLARLCIIFSVKLSSALVAVTANSPGIDNGADVGGAYLTWASAILSSLYHESVMMTFIATGYVVHTDTWYPNLRVYLSPWYKHLKNPETEGFELQDMEESNDSSPSDQVRSRYQALSLFERIKGGRIDRHLLIFTALLHVAMELITLIISLLQLLNDLSTTSAKDSVFVDAGYDPGFTRCPIRLSDLAVCFATVAVQGIYLLTRQHSLVPLLALTSELKLGKRRNPQRLIWLLRWVTWAILALWVASLLCLPLLKGPMEPLFIVGDVSLFWYVMIAPPSYTAPSFIVTAIVSVTVAAIGAFMILRLGRASARVHEND